MKALQIARFVVVTVVLAMGVGARADSSNGPFSFPQRDIADAHGSLPTRCIYDTPEFRAFQQRNPVLEATRVTTSGVPARAFGPTARTRLAIDFSTDDLFDPSRYCTQAGETRSDLDGGSFVCTEADILTDEKRANILKYLSAGVDLVADRLLADPLEGRWTIQSCFEHTVPPSHKTDGVGNVTLYVSAVPIATGNALWAVACGVSGRRPLFIGVNMAPSYFTSPDGPAGERLLTRTIAHQLMHGLGFGGSFFWANMSISGETRRGRERTVVTEPAVATVARSYFDCPTLTGPELEDEAEPYIYHWKRRTHKDDLMNPWLEDGAMFISPLTLTMMEWLGFYSVDYSKAETPLWMRETGCGVHNSRCDTSAGGLGRWFCNPYVTNDGCSGDYTSAGYCGTLNYPSGLPVEDQYFVDPYLGGAEPYMNHCPVITPEVSYECYRDGTSELDALRANYHGTDSLCFKTSYDVFKGNYSELFSLSARCLRKRCVPSVESPTLLVEFQIGDNPLWIRCLYAGQVITLSSYGYGGSVTCPDASTHCDPYVTTAPATTVTSATEPTTVTSTTEPTTVTSTTEPTTVTSTTEPTTTEPTTVTSTTYATTEPTTVTSTTCPTTEKRTRPTRPRKPTKPTDYEENGASASSRKPFMVLFGCLMGGVVIALAM